MWNGFSIQLSPVLAQPCCWRVAPQQSPFPRPAALQNYKFFIEYRNNEIKSLNLHRHLRYTGLRELASDTLCETLPTWNVIDVILAGLIVLMVLKME